MADIFANLTRVQYICSCGQTASINHQYFCRHCLEIKCQECVFTVPEFIFCPNCFESIAGSELKTRRHNCSHCFKCPRCPSTLSVQQYLVCPEEGGGTETTPAADKDGKSPRGAGSKAYYLRCLFCQWNTREADIPDAASPLDFKQPVDENKERVQQLIEHYKQLALVDRVERDKRRKAKRHIKPYSSLLDPSRSPKLSGLSARPSGDVPMVDPNAVAAEASEEVEGVPEEVYTQPVVLENITTIEQRLAYPRKQPVFTRDLWPRPFPLTGKRLRRCGKCDHILCKSEYNPSSVRYKIQQIARFTVPQVRIKTLPKLDTEEEEVTLILSVTNPTSAPLTVSFHGVEDEEVTKKFPDCLLKVKFPEGEFSVSAADDVGDMLEASEEEVDPEAAKFIVDKEPGEVHLLFSLLPPFPEGASSKFLSKLHFTWTTPDSPPEVKNLQTTLVVDVTPISS